MLRFIPSFYVEIHFNFTKEWNKWFRMTLLKYCCSKSLHSSTLLLAKSEGWHWYQTTSLTFEFSTFQNVQNKIILRFQFSSLFQIMLRILSTCNRTLIHILRRTSVLMILVEALVLSPHSKNKENTFLYQWKKVVTAAGLNVIDTKAKWNKEKSFSVLWFCFIWVAPRRYHHLGWIFPIQII